MSTATPPYSPLPMDDSTHPFRWLFLGLSVMFILIGIGVLLSVVSSTPSYNFSTPWTTWNSVYGWTIGVFVFIIFVLIAVAIARSVVYGPRYASRRYWRRYGRWGANSAVDVARERYARGEITREQLDQITADLDRHESTRYPYL
jgi:uncharacterized membrane protein